jgi:hypothetical protein
MIQDRRTKSVLSLEAGISSYGIYNIHAFHEATKHISIPLGKLLATRVNP